MITPTTVLNASLISAAGGYVVAGLIGCRRDMDFRDYLLGAIVTGLAVCAVVGAIYWGQ